MIPCFLFRVHLPHVLLLGIVVILTARMCLVVRTASKWGHEGSAAKTILSALVIRGRHDIEGAADGPVYYMY